MTPKAVRRFTLIDAMTLVAATAAGFTLARSWHFDMSAERGEIGKEFEVLYALGRWTNAGFHRILAPGLPCLVAWTVAVVFLRLRRPRPTVRRLARLPGFLACVLPLLVLLLRLIFFECWMLRPHTPPGYDLSRLSFLTVAAWTILLGAFPYGAPYEAGMAVGAAWLSLSIAGRWKAEATWVDRAGRVLGVLWLAMIPVCYWWVFLFFHWFA